MRKLRIIYDGMFDGRKNSKENGDALDAGQFQMYLREAMPAIAHNHQSLWETLERQGKGVVNFKVLSFQPPTPTHP